MARRYIGLLGATAAFVAGSPAIAQSQRLPDPKLEVALEYNLRYDSNIVQISPDDASRRGLSNDDIRATPSVRVTLVKPFARSVIQLNATAGYDFYHRNHVLNAERLGLDGTGTFNVSSCSLVLSPSILRRQSNLYSIVPLNLPTESSVKNIETVQNYGADLSCGSSVGFRPFANASRVIGDNSNAFRRISDYRETTYGGGIEYYQPTLGRFRLGYSRDTNDYPNRPAIFGDFGYDSNRYTLSASRDIGAVLQGNASISYVDLQPKSNLVPDFNGINWSVSLTALPLPDLSITGTTSNDVGPSLFNDSSFIKTRSYSLAANYAVNSYWNANLGVNTRTRDYVGAGAIYGPLLTRDTFTQVQAGLVYNPVERLQMTLTAAYEKRSANGSLFDYDNKWAAIGFSFIL